MKVFENVNTARKKFGNEIVDKILNAGIPEKYLNSACKFYKEEDVSVSFLRHFFKLWDRFVKPLQKYDVNNISKLSEFITLTLETERNYIPKKQIYKDDSVVIGIVENYKDISNINFPIQNKWCIKDSLTFEVLSEEWNFYLLNFNIPELDVFRYYILQISKKGPIRSCLVDVNNNAYYIGEENWGAIMLNDMSVNARKFVSKLIKKGKNQISDSFSLYNK